jgi:hypothetical protein
MSSAIDTIPVVALNTTGGGFVAPPGNGAGAYKTILTLSDITPAGSATLDSASNDFAGQPFGCFQDSQGAFVLYSVLLER